MLPHLFYSWFVHNRNWSVSICHPGLFCKDQWCFVQTLQVTPSQSLHWSSFLHCVNLAEILEMVTLIPIWMISVQASYQRTLIDLTFLTPEEINWVNLYRSRCGEVLVPSMDDAQMVGWNKQQNQFVSEACVSPIDMSISVATISYLWYCTFVLGFLPEMIVNFFWFVLLWNNIETLHLDEV